MDTSLGRGESTTTQFFKLVGAITAGRPQLYHTVQASDDYPNQTAITVEKNKEVILEYGLGDGDINDYNVAVRDSLGSIDEEEQGGEVSNTFGIPLFDIKVSLIGPEVINNWSIFIYTPDLSAPFRLFNMCL